MDRTFPPTRAAGLDRLRAFAPRMGRAYAAGRNADPGPDGEPDVSALSPYLRHRLLLESEVARAAIDAHGGAAGKFVDEVVWRTYWKGYLEQRPGLWSAFRRGLAADRDRLAVEGGLRRVYEDATEGNTGIDCFDAWARELVSTNWLHNHTRMWFASIWIFTLRLPWTLGAAFFLRHLVDGDPASNTLSWRWVGGLHTRGKHYVARAENIARYTHGRFDPQGQLDEAPDPLVETLLLPAPRLPPADAPPAGDVALLLHDEDCCPESLDLGPSRVVSAAAFSATGRLLDGGVAAPVTAFARGALDDATAWLERPVTWLEPDDVAGWVAAQATPVVTPYAPVGPTADILAGLPVRRIRRGWDETGWPRATRGFFQMRDAIPELVATADP